MSLAFVRWFYSRICRWPKPKSWPNTVVWCLLMDFSSGWASSASYRTQLHTVWVEIHSLTLSAEHILSRRVRIKLRIFWHALLCIQQQVHMQIKDSTRFLLVKESHCFARTLRSWIKLKCIFSSRKALAWEKKSHHLFYLKLTSYFP